MTASAAKYAPEEHHSRYQGIKHLQSLCRVCHSESDNEHLKHAFENVDEEDVRGTPASRKDEQDAIQGGRSRAERVDPWAEDEQLEQGRKRKGRGGERVNGPVSLFPREITMLQLLKQDGRHSF